MNSKIKRVNRINSANLVKILVIGFLAVAVTYFVYITGGTKSFCSFNVHSNYSGFMVLGSFWWIVGRDILRFVYRSFNATRCCSWCYAGSIKLDLPFAYVFIDWAFNRIYD